MDVQLVHDAFTVARDRFWADAEFLGNLYARKAICNKLQHLAFPAAEYIQIGDVRLRDSGWRILLVNLFRQPPVIVQQPARLCRLEVDLAARNGADRLQQLIRRCLLGHIPRGSGGHHLKKVLRIGVNG